MCPLSPGVGPRRHSGGEGGLLAPVSGEVVAAANELVGQILLVEIIALGVVRVAVAGAVAGVVAMRAAVKKAIAAHKPGTNTAIRARTIYLSTAKLPGGRGGRKPKAG